MIGGYSRPNEQIGIGCVNFAVFDNPPEVIPPHAFPSCLQCVAVRRRRLQVVDADDLVDPPDEGGDLDVDAGHVLPAAAEAPRHEPGQLVVALVLAHERAATVTLQVQEIQA